MAEKKEVKNITKKEVIIGALILLTSLILELAPYIFHLDYSQYPDIYDDVTNLRGIVIFAIGAYFVVRLYKIRQSKK